jgi:ribosomal-protein-alanine N-acetyltransferase
MMCRPKTTKNHPKESIRTPMGNDLHFETFPLLETERLILRELRPEDAEAVFRILSDAEVVRYYDPLMTHLEQAQRSIERHRARFENNEGIRWGITIKGEDTIVGNCGFFRDKDNFSAALSYVLAKSSWNKGFMPEALSAIIAFGFEHYHLHRIEAHVARPNLASVRVLQKLGFQEEGLLRESLFENKRFHDEKVFALLKSDFRQKGSRE